MKQWQVLDLFGGLILFKILCSHGSFSAYFEFLRHSNEDFYTLALPVYLTVLERVM